jgi:hypothetical protein
MKRFWDKVIKQPNGCWEWQASCNKSGHGQFKLYDHGNGKQSVKRAHQVSWWLEKGEWPSYCCHTCDNACCVNPDHLYDGTHQDNMNDKSNRHPGWAGNQLSDHQIRRIRREYAIGLSSNQLKNKYPISKSTVLNILNGKIKPEVGGPIRDRGVRYKGNRYKLLR